MELGTGRCPFLMLPVYLTIFCTVRHQISSLTQSLWQNPRETTSEMNRAMSKPCCHALAFSDILLRLYLTFVPNLCGTDGQR